MKQELIKPVIRVGNSAGVLVPKDWINGKARVELIDKPIDIKKDILEILSPNLEDIIGIYLIGSYVRGEQTERSDVDVLVITNKTSKRIKKVKYDILLITKKDVDNTLKDNALPLIPMLREARAIINKKLIEQYINIELNKRNLKPYIELGKSILKVNRASIDIDKQWPSNCGDAVAYSLVLRLRSAYIVDCLIKKGRWSNKEFIGIVKKISGSLKAYEGYLRAKDDKPEKEELPILEAERLYSQVLKKIKEHEEWVKRKR